MHPYSDPASTGKLDQEGALSNYRSLVHNFYVEMARSKNSAFTLLGAFDAMDGMEPPQLSEVTWIAFPNSAQTSDRQIDQERFADRNGRNGQDEYVEWHVEKENSRVTRIIFTTDFHEYFQAFAEVGMSTLVRSIQDIIPGANPTAAELFGPNFDPDSAGSEDRGKRFVFFRQQNPWNNGEKGILCLGHENNTMFALFKLVCDCSVEMDGPANEVCAINGFGCEPRRNSDPVVCTAAQNTVRIGNAISLADPVGITIKSLSGIWKINGEQIDINDSQNNQGVWTISRNGRRAVLDVRTGLTQVDAPIRTGAQVARALHVGATVVTAPENRLPAWAQTGHESSRVIG